MCKLTLEQTKHKIKILENENQHTLVMFTIARYLEDDHYVQIFSRINALKDLDRYSNSYLLKYETYKWNEMKMKHAEKVAELEYYIPSNVLDGIEIDEDSVPF